jgi:hypothetical protein
MVSVCPRISETEELFAFPPTVAASAAAGAPTTITTSAIANVAERRVLFMSCPPAAR